MFSIDEILKELEIVLMIEGTAYSPFTTYNDTIKRIREGLTIQYGIDLKNNNTLGEAIESTTSERNSFVLLDSIQRVYSMLSAYVMNCTYKNECPVSLASIDYLGASKDTFLNFIGFAATEGKANQLDTSFEFIKDKLDRISISIEKRLLLIMTVAFDLGMYELEALVASLFQLGEIINE